MSLESEIIRESGYCMPTDVLVFGHAQGRFRIKGSTDIHCAGC